MPSYFCYNGSKNAEMLIWMSVSNSTFVRLDGQIWKCTIIWSVSHHFVIWLTYTADEYRSLQTQKTAHRKLFTHSSSAHSSPWHYWWMLLDRFWWNCAKHCPLHKCTEHTGQPHTVCTPYPFMVRAFTFSHTLLPSWHASDAMVCCCSPSLGHGLNSRNAFTIAVWKSHQQMYRHHLTDGQPTG